MANIILRNRYSLHRTPLDVENNRAIARMYGAYNVRPGFMYPESPNGMAGLGFDYYDLLAESGREDCDPRDSACVMRNSERVIAVQDLWNTQYLGNQSSVGQAAPPIHITLDTSQAAQQAFMNNQPLTTEQIAVGSGTPTSVKTLETTSQFYTSPTAKASSGSGVARLSFSTSTGDTGHLHPGDTWTIDLTGAAPNSDVYIMGGQNGAASYTKMGRTDGNGAWHANGAIDTSNIGNWSQQVSVNGAVVGTINFTVTAQTQQQQAAATGKPNASVPSNQQTTPCAPVFDSTGKKIEGQCAAAGIGTGTETGTPDTGSSTGLLLAAGIAALFLLTRHK